MFSGIVAGTGRVVAIDAAAGAAFRLTVDLGALPRRPALGASVSVAGVCLTVAALRGRRAGFDVIGQTVRRTTLGSLRVGDVVNLEGALRVGDEIGGHEVSGHVDGVGRVTAVERRGDETRVTVDTPAAVRRTLVPRGFVAVDGVSLTVAALSRRTFTVALIPTTLAVTTLSRVAVGASVNLEADPLGRRAVGRSVRAKSRGSKPRTRRTGTRRT